MPELKILCTSDLHLGRSSACLDIDPSIDCTATGAWRRIVRLAIGSGASAVVIAGDVFDTLGSYYESRNAFAEGVRNLASENIPVVAVAGNHDWEALPRYVRQHPDDLIYLGANGAWESRVVPTKHGEVTFVGWSFPSEHVRDRQFENMPKTRGKGPTVGVIHGDLIPNSAYHPMSLADFESGADLWVVGHVHLPQEIGLKAVYCGSPQALDFGPGERGLHGIRWLTWKDASPKFSKIVPMSTVRFEECTLEVRLGEDESAWDAAFRVAEEKANSLRLSANESIQIRAELIYDGVVEVASVKGKMERSSNGRDTFHFTNARCRPPINPWELVSSSNAVGEAARLLLGASPRQDDERMPDELWILQAEALIEEGAKDVSNCFAATMGKVGDDGENSWEPPTIDEARELARQALIAELEELVQSGAQEAMV